MQHLRRCGDDPAQDEDPRRALRGRRPRPAGYHAHRLENSRHRHRYEGSREEVRAVARAFRRTLRHHRDGRQSRRGARASARPTRSRPRRIDHEHPGRLRSRNGRARRKDALRALGTLYIRTARAVFVLHRHMIHVAAATDQRRETVKRALTTILAVLLIATACSAHKSPAASKASAPAPPAIAPLTGLVVPHGSAFLTRAALAVKIENTPDARPQSGLDNADIVVEEQVEGGITRFIAIFQSRDARVVGPVRSARPEDPDLLRQYGAILA